MGVEDEIEELKHRVEALEQRSAQYSPRYQKSG
jgi:BMFP domain-containing protein YqiC